MKRLLSYLGRYRLYAVLAPLFKCLEACFELFIPLVVANMIDVGIAHADLFYIFRMGGLLILLGLIGLLCSITAQYFSANVAVKTGTLLRKDLFSHILGLGYAEIDRLGTSTLLTRMTSDINQVQTGVNMFLRLFMRSPFIVFGAVIMAFTVDVRGALIFAVTVPLLGLSVFGILLGTMPLYKRVQSQLDLVMRTVRENLLGVRVVRAFSMEEAEKAAFKKENDRLLSLQIFVGKLSALLNPMTVVIVDLAIVVLLYTGGLEVQAGLLSQGKVVALVNYMSQILVELVKLANLIILISKAVACMNRVDAVFSVESGIEEGKEKACKEEGADGNRGNGCFREGKEEACKEEGADSKRRNDCFKKARAEDCAACDAAENGIGAKNEPDRETVQPEAAVTFSHVSFTYPGAKEPSLKDVSFAARRGETIGVIGGTGAGKTTLVNLIPRFYDADNGGVCIEGRDVRAFNVQALRMRIGPVPQKALLFAGSLRDNMRWGKADASDEEILAALHIAQADDILAKKPEGLDFMLEQGGRNLSGGQRQRLTIARAVVRRPRILILDDSASALDFATDAALRRALKEETEDMTVFLISQRVSTVKAADRILVLDDGRAAGFGSHQELLSGCAVYREICLSQMSGEEVKRSETARS